MSPASSFGNLTHCAFTQVKDAKKSDTMSNLAPRGKSVCISALHRNEFDSGDEVRRHDIKRITSPCETFHGLEKVSSSVSLPVL